VEEEVAGTDRTPNRRKTKSRATVTSSFGVSKRESHDASDFYSRFEPPKLLSDNNITPCPVQDQLFCGDSRQMKDLPDNCIALVVTSPPYFAGKAYEAELGENGIPGSYVEYLEMLRGVFSECWRVLEPGGRIAINVANLGRKPYRSLAGDVTALLQDELGFLLRGEIVWIKAEGSSGNCAWGSYASASNPVLRDVTERIIVASKGRFDRALNRKEREARGLPFENSIDADDFRAWTLDTWKIPPVSATRVGHPAPFPVELPRRCIELFTYKGDTVLDPFMGAGQTAIAAAECGRHWVGYELDADYVELAQRRITESKTV